MCARPQSYLLITVITKSYSILIKLCDDTWILNPRRRRGTNHLHLDSARTLAKLWLCFMGVSFVSTVSCCNVLSLAGLYDGGPAHTSLHQQACSATLTSRRPDGGEVSSSDGSRDLTKYHSYVLLFLLSKFCYSLLSLLYPHPIWILITFNEKLQSSKTVQILCLSCQPHGSYHHMDPRESAKGTLSLTLDSLRWNHQVLISVSPCTDVLSLICGCGRHRVK